MTGRRSHRVHARPRSRLDHPSPRVRGYSMRRVACGGAVYPIERFGAYQRLRRGRTAANRRRRPPSRPTRSSPRRSCLRGRHAPTQAPDEGGRPCRRDPQGPDSFYVVGTPARGPGRRPHANRRGRRARGPAPATVEPVDTAPALAQNAPHADDRLVLLPGARHDGLRRLTPERPGRAGRASRGTDLCSFCFPGKGAERCSW